MGHSNSTDGTKLQLHNRAELIIAILLTLAIVIIYFQVRQHDFVVYDDRVYVTENEFVQDGLTVRGLKWAFDFTEKDKTYWHPLTWLSHMVDIQIFGMNAGKHLIINALLHILNTLLLFYLFRRMTESIWPSAIVAALFAVHPLNVESVAWVAARKNLLSTTCWMFTILAYLRYIDRPSFKRYALIMVVFSIGLTAKPMLVTLPCVLFLLDFWPLGRISAAFSGDRVKPKAAIGSLILEKIPMLVLSAISIYIATFSLYHFGDLVSVESVGLRMRLANALVSYVAYLGKMLTPLKLTCFYPFPLDLPWWKPLGSLVFLVAVTSTAFRVYHRYPFFLIGWLWFLGTLFPVIGLMQAGLWPAMADRFVYVPLIGIFIIIAWGAAELLIKSNRNVVWIATSAAILLSVLVVLSHNQVGYWKNSITLFNHAISITKNNYLSHYALGYAYEQKGKVDDAIHHYKAALEINPNEVDVHYNLAILLASKGHFNGAIRHYKNVLQIEPEDAQAHNNLGNIFFRQNNWDKAIRRYQEAIRINPEYAKAHNNLGAAMFRRGRIPEAVHHFSEALRIRPEDEQARRYLQMAIAQLENKSKSSAPVATP